MLAKFMLWMFSKIMSICASVSNWAKNKQLKIILKSYGFELNEKIEKVKPEDPIKENLGKVKSILEEFEENILKM